MVFFGVFWCFLVCFVFFGVFWRFLAFFGLFDSLFGFLVFFCVDFTNFRSKQMIDSGRFVGLFFGGWVGLRMGNQGYPSLIKEQAQDLAKLNLGPEIASKHPLGLEIGRNYPSEGSQYCLGFAS